MTDELEYAFGTGRQSTGYKVLRAVFFMAIGSAVTLGVQAVSSDDQDAIQVAPLVAESHAEPVAEHAPPPPEPAIVAAAPTPEREEDHGSPMPELVPIPDKKGRLELITKPPVAVYKKKRRVGRTPLTLTLSPGKHTFEFRDRRRHLKVKRKFVVQAGKRIKRKLTFGTSKLRVKAPNGTRLYIDKKYVGRAPFRPIEIAEGRHRLSLVRRGQKHKETIRVPPSRTIDYSVTF